MRSNKYIKVLIIALALMLAAALAAAVGCAKKDPEAPVPTEQAVNVDPTPSVEPTSETTPEPTATPVPEFVANPLPGRDGSVVAISTGTYGVATDGSIRFMGRSVTGQHYIKDWKDVVQVAASDNTTVALLGDGTLRMTGTHAEDFAEANDWTDIAAISVGEAHLVALHTDGTVSAVGDNSKGQLEVGEWARVIKVFAINDFTVALTDRGGAGLLDTLHGNIPLYGNDETEYVSMAAASDHIALLSADGHVFTFKYGEQQSAAREDGRDPAVRMGFSDTGWSSIKKVFAAEGATYGLGPGGELYSIGADEILSDVQSMTANIYSIAAAKEHIVLLYGDGTAEGFGKNEDLQCNVGVWRLMPYVDEEGYLLGYSEGDEINGETYHTGLEMSFMDPVTGEQRTVTAVLLGDLNGDGAIDSADGELMSAYRSGSGELEGAFLRASNIIDDDSNPGKTDAVDFGALRRHLEGSQRIDQFAKKDMYTSPIADARRVNSDVVGYITLEGTNIDYPIMYGENWYYHTRGLGGGYLERGSIYTYWSKAGKNIVITGHNARQSGTMFHQLHYIQDRASNLSEYANRLWCINVYGETGYWEVWAMYEEGTFSNPNNSSLTYNTCYPYTMEALNEQEQQGWIFYQMGKNKLNYSVDVTTQDRFITLVTCGDTHAASEQGSRLYFFLRWVGGN